MIKKRDAIGKLYTPSQNFIILQQIGKGNNFIGCENDKSKDKEMDVWVFPASKRIKVIGDYVLTKYNQPKEIYIFVGGEENETNGKWRIEVR